jgi:predicted subunit of tRNA(5-methylaminomethyl-2-thiouridylate) methyltransferase
MDKEPDLEIFKKINDALEDARAKHPLFSDGRERAFAAVKSEMLEWESQALMVQAGIPGKWHRAEEEAYHVIVTLIRYIRGI